MYEVSKEKRIPFVAILLIALYATAFVAIAILI